MKSADKILPVIIFTSKQNCFQSGSEHCQSSGLSHIFWKTGPDFRSIKLKCSFTLFSPDSGHQQETTT